jgi:hypothetical protein
VTIARVYIIVWLIIVSHKLKPFHPHFQFHRKRKRKYVAKDRCGVCGVLRGLFSTISTEKRERIIILKWTESLPADTRNTRKCYQGYMLRTFFFLSSLWNWIVTSARKSLRDGFIYSI